jgi:hypothetical protein
MEVYIKVPKRVEIKTLEVKARVRYWEDAYVNGEMDDEGTLIPFREGELWCPVIDIDSGTIIGWPQGTKASIHYKICDAGSYYLKDDQGETVIQINQNYVPSILSPKENGYGDYIIMDIDETGKIDNWKKDISSFTDEED